MKSIDMGRSICDCVMSCIVFDNAATFLMNVVQLSRKFFHSSTSKDI